MFWVELHCDVQKSVTPMLNLNKRPIRGIMEPCESSAGNSPGIMVSRLARAGPYLVKEAKQVGWKKTKAGWACPKCQGAKI